MSEVEKIRTIKIDHYQCVVCGYVQKHGGVCDKCEVDKYKHMPQKTSKNGFRSTYPKYGCKNCRTDNRSFIDSEYDRSNDNTFYLEGICCRNHGEPIFIPWDDAEFFICDLHQHVYPNEEPQDE